MPPKKSTVNAELKKKNKEEAQNLVKMLEQQKSNVEDAVSSPSKRGRKAAASTSTASGQGKHDSKRTVKKGESGSNRSTEKDNQVSKNLFEKLDSVSSSKAPGKNQSNVETDGSKRSAEKEKSGSKRSTEKGNQVSKRVPEKLDFVSSFKKAKIEKPSNDGAEIAKNNCDGKRMPRPAKVFRYEIDCQRVKQSVDVHELQQFLIEEFKVNGEKNNLGENVKIYVDAQKVVINSKVYLPKRSLRYYAKKFLKKFGNVRVTSQNKNSYEFKYVGTS